MAAVGFDWVRIPVQWGCHTSAEPPYTVSAIFLAEVNQTVGWTVRHGLRAMVNSHNENHAVHTVKAMLWQLPVLM